MTPNTSAHAPRAAWPQRPGSSRSISAANSSTSVRLAATPSAPPTPARECPSWEELLGQR